VQGFSPFRAAAWGIAATLVIMLGTALIHRVLVQREGVIGGVVAALAETVQAIYATLHGSMREVMQLIAVCAAAGIVAGVIGVTGVGGRFATMLLDVAGASSFLAMVFAMIVAIILGMGVPTTAAYAIAAAVVAPGLIRIGVEPLVAHMFIFYFAILSAITPPVALASFAAASMAGADMWRTSVIALKLGLATFIVPYLFWLSPSLLAQGPLLGILTSFGTAVCGVYLLACATEGWMQNGPLKLPLRLVSGATGLMLMVPELVTDIAGIAIGIGLLTWQGPPARARGGRGIAGEHPPGRLPRRVARRLRRGRGCPGWSARLPAGSARRPGGRAGRCSCPHWTPASRTPRRSPGAAGRSGRAPPW
jgi:TRAP-type uncharacterized transport system fused permease subunit